MQFIDIDKIKVGGRYRKDLGDIDELATSIVKLGLLQPIGLTKDNQLVFGERRLTACKKLGWEEIPYRLVEFGRIIDGEFAENEMRKQFTASERVAIAEAIKEQIGDRQGQRTDKLVDNYPQVKTR